MSEQEVFNIVKYVLIFFGCALSTLVLCMGFFIMNLHAMKRAIKKEYNLTEEQFIKEVNSARSLKGD